MHFANYVYEVRLKAFKKHGGVERNPQLSRELASGENILEGLCYIFTRFQDLHNLKEIVLAHSPAVRHVKQVEAESVVSLRVDLSTDS